MSNTKPSLTNLWRFLASRAALACGVLLAAGAAPRAQDPIRIKVVGGHAGVNQFIHYEEPFWTKTVGEITGGRVQATIHPFDRSGLRAGDMLQLIRMGVVPFGTMLVAVASREEPELNALDLPALNPDIDTLRTTVWAYRPHLANLLRVRHGIELLGVYTYPAQVLYCSKPFRGLNDLQGRRVRTSSVSQSDLIEALGGVPVIKPFTEIVSAFSQGAVDCAVTGTLSGFEIGLPEVSTHVHALAISWGVSVFGANLSTWQRLPPDLQERLRAGIERLEGQIWASASDDTARGLACNTGSEVCTSGRRGRMTLVPVSGADEASRRTLLTEVVLPNWLDRCGADCEAAWWQTLGPALGIRANGE